MDPKQVRQRKVPDDKMHRVAWVRTLFWLLILAAFVYSWSNLFQGPKQQTLSYTQFKEEIRQGKVAEVTMKGHQVTGQYKQGKQEKQKNQRPKTFQTVLPPINDPELVGLL
jgi:cell division protease FtsH